MIDHAKRETRQYRVDRFTAPSGAGPRAMCVLRRYAAAFSGTAILHRDKLTLHALGRLPIRATITELMHAHLLEVFNDHDAARRRARIEHFCADGIRRIDDVATTGREARDAKAAELQAKLGDLQFIARRSRLSDIGFGLLSVSVGQTRKLGAGELGFDVAIIGE